MRGNEHLDQYRHLRHQMLSHSGLKHKYMSDSWLVNVLEAGGALEGRVKKRKRPRAMRESAVRKSVS